MFSLQTAIARVQNLLHHGPLLSFLLSHVIWFWYQDIVCDLLDVSVL